jgi:hypothetical protein
MANSIKYSTSTQSQALKVGNYWIGTGEIKKGPTSVTDYWNGIKPPSGGYTLYGNKASRGPSVYVVANDSQLINTTNILSGQNFTSVTQSLSWFRTQSDKIVFNREYEPIVTNGLVLNLDAAFSPSYPNTGTTWYNIGQGGANGTLVNGPTYNSEIGGSILFDGIDDVCRFPASTFNAGSPQDGTFYLRIKFPPLDTVNQTILFSDGGNANNLIYLYRNPGFVTDRYSWLLYYNSGSVLLQATYSANTWYDTAMTFTSQGVMSVYVNGAFVTSSTPAGFTSWSRSGTNQPAFKPSSATGSGSAQLLLWYNRALRADEILQNYNALLPRLAYDTDAQSFMTAAIITNTTQKTAVNDLVVGLKTDGIWTKIGVLYPFVGGNATSHSYNLKSPGSYQLTFYGGWTHSSTGAQPNGTNAYAETGYLDNAYGDKMHRAVYSRQNIDGTGYEMGVSYGYSDGESGNVFFNHLQIGTTYFQNQLGDSYTYGGWYGLSTDALGLFTVSRDGTGLGGDNTVSYKRGALISTVNTYSAPYFRNTPANKPLVLSAMHSYYDSEGIPSDGVNSYNNRQQSFVSYGAALTSTEVANLYTRVQAFQTALGRQV